MWKSKGKSSHWMNGRCWYMLRRVWTNLRASDCAVRDVLKCLKHLGSLCQLQLSPNQEHFESPKCDHLCLPKIKHLMKHWMICNEKDYLGGTRFWVSIQLRKQHCRPEWCLGCTWDMPAVPVFNQRAKKQNSGRHQIRTITENGKWWQTSKFFFFSVNQYGSNMKQPLPVLTLTWRQVEDKTMKVRLWGHRWLRRIWFLRDQYWSSVWNWGIPQTATLIGKINEHHDPVGLVISYFQTKPHGKWLRATMSGHVWIMYWAKPLTFVGSLLKPIRYDVGNPINH